jgi:hypothetical protein
MARVLIWACFALLTVADLVALAHATVNGAPYWLILLLAFNAPFPLAFVWMLSRLSR